MTYTNIVYTADNGTQYAVAVPSDFATALGQTAATTQPALPVEVAPRYANFQTTAGIWRQAVVDTVSNFNSIIGSSVTISSVTYTCMSAVGQKTPPVVPSVLSGPNMIQGPPGPTGATGATGATGPTGPAGMSPLTNAQGTIAAASINGGSSGIVQALIAAPGAGNFISVVRSSFKYAAGGAGFSGSGNLNLEIGSVSIASLFSSATLNGTTSNLLESGVSIAAGGAAALENQPLNVVRSAALSGGTGTIPFNVLFQILPL